MENEKGYKDEGNNENETIRELKMLTIKKIKRKKFKRRKKKKILIKNRNE